ncbi:hypothetical protein LguiB_016867 [Lonicera macranthoides]
MARASLPPGFRFHPTDVELVMYYLKRKIMGKKLQFEAISELNIYKYCPWDLKDKSCLRSKDLEWFFFCPRERKYASGARTNRATESGYWKTTGKDRRVIYNDRDVGMVKTLVFHLGHAPQGKRTDWVMHEYRFEDKDLPDAGVVQDAYVLCKVFKKSGPGPKNGAQYGAPFNEDDYDDEGICAESSAVDELAPPLVSPSNNMNGSCSTSMIGPGNSMNILSFSEPGPSTAGPSVSEVSPALHNNDVDMDSLLAVFRVEGTSLPVETGNTEELEALNPDENIAAINCSDGNEIYNGLGDLGYLVDPSNRGFNFANIPEAGYNPIPLHITDDTAFLELNDLNTPLPFPSEASGSTAHLHTANSFAPYACYDSYEHFCREDNFFSAVQNVSALNQLPPLPESLGSHFDSLKENGIGSGANQEGYSAATSGNMYFTHRQAEGSMNAAEAQIRGRYPYMQ